MTGVLFKQLGWMVTIMMVLSLICALMLTPMLCSRLLRLNVTDTTIFKKVYGPILKVLDKIDDFYAKVLDTCVAHRWITTATALGIFVASMFLSASACTRNGPPSIPRSRCLTTPWVRPAAITHMPRCRTTVRTSSR